MPGIFLQNGLQLLRLGDAAYVCKVTSLLQIHQYMPLRFSHPYPARVPFRSWEVSLSSVAIALGEVVGSARLGAKNDKDGSLYAANGKITSCMLYCIY